MVNGVSGSSQNSQFFIQNSNSRAKSKTQEDESKQSPQDGVNLEKSLNNSLSELGFSGSIDFSLDMSKSMQIVEGESKRSISQSLSLEFNLSIDANGKLGGSFAGPGVAEEPKSAEETKDDDPWSAENTANRIIDFVKRAADITKKLGISNLEMDEEKERFETLQVNAVKEGFKQARSLLGSLDTDREDRVNNTYDLVLDGLDRYFHPEKYEDEEEVQSAPEESSEEGTGEGSQFSSSQSFSLNFQVSIEGNGEFNPEELNEFVGDAFSQVQDVFGQFLGGGSEEGEGFNPINLFSLDQIRRERVRSLVGE